MKMIMVLSSIVIGLSGQFLFLFLFYEEILSIQNTNKNISSDFHQKNNLKSINKSI